MTAKSTPGWSGSLPAFARKSLNVANRAAGYIDTIAAAKHTTTPAPIIVVGLPRSGTTLAYELIVQAFDVAYLTRAYSYTFGMPNLTTRLTAPRTRYPKARYESDYGQIPGFFAPAENAVLWSKWFAEHALLGHYFPSSYMTADAAADATATIASMSTIAKRPFVFKNVYLTLSLPAFLQTLTKSRVIVVTREIDAIAASVFKKRRTLPASAWWSICPPFVEHVSHDGIVEQTAFQCVRSKQILDHALALVDQERCMVVDYSKICAAPANFISNVAHWTGNELSRRADSDIPKHFDLSPSPGYPQEVADRFSKQSDALTADRDQYLHRIEEYVRQHSETEL